MQGLEQQAEALHASLADIPRLGAAEALRQAAAEGERLRDAMNGVNPDLILRKQGVDEWTQKLKEGADVIDALQPRWGQK